MKRRKTDILGILISIFLALATIIGLVLFGLSYENGASSKVLELKETKIREDGAYRYTHAASASLFEIEAGESLVYFSKGGETRVFVDGVLVSESEKTPNNTVGGFLVPCWNTVLLSEGKDFSEVVIEYNVPYPGGGLDLSSVSVGEKGIVFTEIIKKDTAFIILCGSFLLIGLMCVAVSFVVKREALGSMSLLYFGFLAMLFALRFMSDRPSLYAYFDAKFLATTFSMAFGLIPVALSAFLSRRYRAEGIRQIVNNILVCVFAIGFLVSCALYFDGIVEFGTSVIAIYICVLPVGALVIKDGVSRVCKERSVQAILGLVSFVILFVGAIYKAVSIVWIDIKNPIDPTGIMLICVLLFISIETFNMVSIINATMIEAHRQKLMLEEAKTRLVLSQIKPHFIYNSLGAIRVLIKKSPDEAYDILYKFSKYLRQNIDVLENSEPIPFKSELEHIETYIELEMLRFHKRFAVSYEISATNFSVPPLSIQIFVENAIKHGLFQKKGKGHLTVRTYGVSRFVYIEIEDDGVGFEEEELRQKQEKGTSVGLKNAVYRIENMLNGMCKITSVPGEGTKVLIRLPRGAETEESTI